ncbi:hypothetical protein BH11VER1_BH11VER1_12120 [soil metagenome]
MKITRILAYEVNESSLAAAVIAGARTVSAEEVYAAPVDVDAPDFVVNAGGIINVAVEKENHYNPDRARQLTDNIYPTITKSFAACDSEHLLPQQAAIRLAERRLNSAAPGCAPHTDVPALAPHESRP